MRTSLIKKLSAAFLVSALLSVLWIPVGAFAEGRDVTFYWGKLRDDSKSDLDINDVDNAASLPYLGLIDHTKEGGFAIYDASGKLQAPSVEPTLNSKPKAISTPLVPNDSPAVVYSADYTLEPGIYKWEGKTVNGDFAGSGRFEVFDSPDVRQNFYLARVVARWQGIGNEKTGFNIDLLDSFADTMKPYNFRYYVPAAGEESGFLQKNYHLIMRLKGNSAYRFQLSSLASKDVVLRETAVLWDKLVSNYCYLNPYFAEADGGAVVPSGKGNAGIKPLTDGTLNIRVPKNASLHVYDKGPHFYPFKEFARFGSPVSDGEDYEIRTFKVSRGVTLHYEAGGESYLRECQMFFIVPEFETLNISTTLSPLVNKRENTGVNTYKDADIYLNTDDSRFIELAVNDSFDFFPLRVMQAQVGDAGNYFAEPDYHFTIIDSDDVREQASKTFDSFKGGSVQSEVLKLEPVGARGREEYKITGLKKGLSVIKITYDAVAWRRDIGQEKQSNNLNAAGYDLVYHNPIEENCTAVVIVNVGETKPNSSETITTHIDEGEDDTIYFPDTETSVGYTFAPTSTLGNVSVRVHAPLHKTKWGEGWTDYGAKESGKSFNVKLKDGRNIVEVRSGEAVTYHTIYAKAIPITITNSNPNWKPGDLFQVGDKVNIQFKDLKTPVQKLAAIYNPGYPPNWENDPNDPEGKLQTVYVYYKTNSGEELKSQRTQYGIKHGVDISLTIEKSGDTVLSDGKIHCEHYGSDWPAHRNISKNGYWPNLSSANNTKTPWHSTLPDIVLTAAAEPVPAPESEEEEEEPDPITPIIPEPEPPVVDDPDPVTPPVTPPEQPEIDKSDEKAPAVVVPIDPEKDVTFDTETGTETVTVPDGALESQIVTAIEEAEKAGSQEPTVLIRATPALDASTGESVTVREVAVEISIGDLIAVKDSNVNVKIASPVGEVTLNTGALADLIARTEAEAENAPKVDIVIAKGTETLAKAEELTEKQEEALKDEKIREVFDISVYAGSENGESRQRLEDFETTGLLTVGLPYALDVENGETQDGVWVYYVKKDGTTEKMKEGRRYDEKNGLAVFQTSHLSVYAIAYEESAKSGGSGGCDAGVFGGFGLLALVVAALTAARRSPEKR